MHLQAGYCDDAEVVYSFLDTNKIGEIHSIFYISYATHMESKNKIKTANDIYECGIARYACYLYTFHLIICLFLSSYILFYYRNAQPIEKLKSAYKKFFVRSMSRPKAIEVCSLILLFC